MSDCRVALKDCERMSLLILDDVYESLLLNRKRGPSNSHCINSKMLSTLFEA